MSRKNVCHIILSSVDDSYQYFRILAYFRIFSLLEYTYIWNLNKMEITFCRLSYILNFYLSNYIMSVFQY
jgi:hypothetical protein